MIYRLLYLTLMLSVLLFGSVEVWSSTGIQFLVFTLGLIWVLGGKYSSGRISGPVRLLMITGLAFTAYGALQALPLPPALLKLVSPASFQMQSFYSVSGKTAGTISLNPYGTVYETIKSAAFFTVFAVSAYGFRSRETLDETLRIFTVFGFCLAIFAIIQKATWNDGIYWFRELTLGGEPFGPFVNRNHFAGLMGMLVPLGLGVAITRQDRARKLIFGFMAVIMAVSLFFSLSRGGITSFFAGISIFALLMLQLKGRSQKIWITGFFVAAVLSYVVYIGIEPIIERFYKTDIAGEQRLVVWSAAWSASKDFWLTGSGLGSFMNIFPLYSPPSITSIYDHAHNDYVEFFLETGLVGTLFLAAFAGLLIHAIFTTPLTGRKGVLRAAALSSAFAMLVHSLFDFNLHILSNMLIFGSVLGMIAGLSCSAEDPEEPAGIKLKRAGTGTESQYGRDF